MLGLPFVNLHDIFGDVCHNRSQTLYVVVHVVLQCGILGHFSRVGEHMQSKTPISPPTRHLIHQYHKLKLTQSPTSKTFSVSAKAAHATIEGGKETIS